VNQFHKLNGPQRSWNAVCVRVDENDIVRATVDATTAITTTSFSVITSATTTAAAPTTATAATAANAFKEGPAICLDNP
jgi:hypothetical protein